METVRSSWWIFVALAFAACSGSGEDSLRSANIRDDGGEHTEAGPASQADAQGPDDDAGEPADPLDAGEGGASQADAGDQDAEAPRREVFANADTGDDANPGSQAAPVKTLRRAFEIVGEHGLVWLQPSTFDASSEELSGPDMYTGRSVPAGVLLRTTGPGVQFGITLQFPAGGAVEELTVDTATMGRILVSGGQLRARALRVERSLEVGGVGMGLELSGDAHVTLEPGSDPEHNYLGVNMAPALATVADSAELTILGGRIQPPASSRGGHILALSAAAKLTLRNVVITSSPELLFRGTSAVFMGGVGNRVLIEQSRIDLRNSGNAVCVIQDDNSAVQPPFQAELTILDSVLTGCGGGALQLREGEAVVRVEDSELSGAHDRFGIEAGRIGFDAVNVPGRPQVTLRNTIIRANNLAGIHFNAGGSLDVQGGSIEGNGRPPMGASQSSGYGALVLGGAFPYTLSMRGVRVVGNWHFGVYGALDLAGDASSRFDLGTRASPGDNVFTGNLGPQIRLRVAEGVRVDAVGNTWQPEQGAEATGQYTVSGALCANANPCDQAGGNGPNFAFTDAGAGATLRLAEQ